MLIKHLIKHFLWEPIRDYRDPYYKNRFLKLVGDPSSLQKLSPLDFYRSCSDEYFYWLIGRSGELGINLNGWIPPLPLPYMQKGWTGKVGKETMREAFLFYRIVKQLTQKYAQPIDENTKVLDFGCGWGRVIRFFLKDVAAINLYGCDCFSDGLQAASEHIRGPNFVLNDTEPPLPYDDNSFDLIYLYSVFSHLSELAHMSWLDEFQRVLKPGGVLVATTRPREMIKIWSQDHRKDLMLHPGAQQPFQDTEHFLKEYDRGSFCHSASGGDGPLSSSFYGESCIPKDYVLTHWSDKFTLKEYRLTDGQCNQNIICCKAKKDR
ncbi:class I SAM-dependent methyltransferase [Pseudomonadota bacterium]